MPSDDSWDDGPTDAGSPLPEDPPSAGDPPGRGRAASTGGFGFLQRLRHLPGRLKAGVRSRSAGGGLPGATLPPHTADASKPADSGRFPAPGGQPTPPPRPSGALKSPALARSVPPIPSAAGARPTQAPAVSRAGPPAVPPGASPSPALARSRPPTASAGPVPTRPGAAPRPAPEAAALPAKAPAPATETAPGFPAGGGGGGGGGTGGGDGGGTGGIEVTNPSDGGFIYWLLRFYAFGLIAVGAIGMCVAIGTYVYFAATLPPLPDLATYQSQVATTTYVRGWDGTPLAEFATERREILPFERIPPRLIQAFLAAEDRRYYEHGGIDYRGIMRALGANLRAGEVAQGGSTITQQVAKSFLSSERTIERKLREAIMARRLEGRLTKNEILTLYLNQIFLGAGAYGVGGGARRYFDKAVDELDLGEMATLAGLVRAPSRFSPLANLEVARARRDQVLTAMVDSGYVSDVEATTWKARPLRVRPRADFFRTHAPYFTEHVRRDIAKRYGDKKLWEGGFEVDTTVVPWIDASAQENVDFGLRKLDKRQGWRGPVARLSGPPADEFKRRALERYGGEPPVEGRLVLGIVEGVSSTGDARVRVGKNTYRLPGDNMLWAVPYSLKDSVNGRTLKSAAGVLHTGDVIWVKNAHRSKLRRFSDFTYDEKSEVQWMQAYDETKPGAKIVKPAPNPPELTLEQTPRVQGAIFSYDHASGYVVSMIGGSDYDRSEFNRVTQACRQPGSSYKPMYYSLALDRGFGFNSLLNDLPRAEVDPITGEVWTPTNLNNTVEYQVSLEYALIWSKNVPSVQLFKLMGGREVEAWARRLGITTPIIPDQALALGASCSRMDEMTRAFSAFARNGVLVDYVSVRRVRDRSGRILEDNTWVGDPMGRPEDRLDQLVATAGKKVVPTISPKTAWLTSTLLRHVVTRGHAPAIRSASLMAAGKTGTSSATMDVWFIGYTSRWMTSTWVGDDLRQRPLGAKDAAFMLTVPMFARYINEVSVGQPLREVPWERPPGVKPNDTGGSVRTTLDEVVGDGKKGGGRIKAPPVPNTPPVPITPPAPPAAATPPKAAPVAAPSATPTTRPTAAVAPVVMPIPAPKTPAAATSKPSVTKPATTKPATTKRPGKKR